MKPLYREAKPAEATEAKPLITNEENNAAIFNKAQKILHDKYRDDWAASGHGGPSPRTSTINPDGSVTINNKHGELLKVITLDDIKEYDAQQAEMEEKYRRQGEERDRVYAARMEARKQRLANGEEDRDFADILDKAEVLLVNACCKAMESTVNENEKDEELAWLLEQISEKITNYLTDGGKYTLSSSLQWDSSYLKDEFNGEFRPDAEEEEE